nr:MAG TPA: hypothetical protein [Caudoviricetes sp.]
MLILHQCLILQILPFSWFVPSFHKHLLPGSVQYLMSCSLSSAILKRRLFQL